MERRKVGKSKTHGYRTGGSSGRSWSHLASVRMRPLSKRDIEELLHEYDSDPVAALLAALRKNLSGEFPDWTAAIHALNVSDSERSHLLAQEISALDALVKQLVEFRGLQQ